MDKYDALIIGVLALFIVASIAIVNEFSQTQEGIAGYLTFASNTYSIHSERIPPQSALSYWEKREGVTFTFTENENNADIVVKEVKEFNKGVLGHADASGEITIAKGDVECRGNYYLYDDATRNAIFTHEIGHVLGHTHSHDDEDIMFPTLEKSYEASVTLPNQRISKMYEDLTCQDIIKLKSLGAEVN